jgi:hypothetical protein
MRHFLKCSDGRSSKALEVVRKQAPSTTALEYVEDGVEDLAGVVESRATSTLGEMCGSRQDYSPSERSVKGILFCAR